MDGQAVLRRKVGQNATALMIITLHLYEAEMAFTVLSREVPLECHK
jgi:hypothetical protein